MRGRAGRIGLLVALLALVPTPPVWAGSAQAPLFVGAVVPARCAVSTPTSFGLGAGSSAASLRPVTMRCTKGTLPSDSRTVSATAVGPRISRDVVFGTSPSPSMTPRPSVDSDPVGTEQLSPRVVITVNF